MGAPLEDDGRALTLGLMRAAFPTKNGPRMADLPDRFELRLSKARSRFVYLLWCGVFALFTGGAAALSLRGGQRVPGIPLAVAGAGFAALGLALAMGAKEHLLTVTRDGIRLRKAADERFEPSDRIVEVVLGSLATPFTGEGPRQVEDRLEVVVQGKLPWALILTQGGKYRRPLADAIGRLCGAPVRDLGEVEWDGRPGQSLVPRKVYTGPGRPRAPVLQP